MSKVHIGVGDDFPVNDASDTQTRPCSRAHARWAARCHARKARCEARRAARRERWRQWRAFWTGADRNSNAQTQGGDASYTDVPPRDKKDL